MARFVNEVALAAAIVSAVLVWTLTWPVICGVAAGMLFGFTVLRYLLVVQLRTAVLAAVEQLEKNT